MYSSYKLKKWHPKQQDVLDRIKERTTIDDEEVKKTTLRFLYVKGKPGSGKTAVLIEGAVRAAKDGLTVLIVCPTGALVCALKELLPEFDGVERIHVDTIHSVLKYKRDRDNKVEFVPLSGFRKCEAVFFTTRGRSMTIWSGTVCSRRSGNNHTCRMSWSSLISSSLDP